MMAVLTNLPEAAERKYKSLQETLRYLYKQEGTWSAVCRFLEREYGYKGSKATLYRIVNEQKGFYYPNDPDLCKQLQIPYFEFEMKWSEEAKERKESTDPRERFRIDLDPDTNEGLKTLIRALPREVRTNVLIERALEKKEKTE